THTHTGIIDRCQIATPTRRSLPSTMMALLALKGLLGFLLESRRSRIKDCEQGDLTFGGFGEQYEYECKLVSLIHHRKYNPSYDSL
ncbi:unnamed protein product, partial [Musa acuminata subsp. burmannicoides]